MRAARDRPRPTNELVLKQSYQRIHQILEFYQQIYDKAVLSWFVFNLFGLTCGGVRAKRVQKSVLATARRVIGAQLVTPAILFTQSQNADASGVLKYLALLFDLSMLLGRSGAWDVSLGPK